MDKHTLRIGIVSITIIAALVGYYIYGNLSKRPEFSTYQVSKGEISDVLNVSGKVVPEISADLGFETGGKITALNYKVGDEVPQGAILAYANSSDLNYKYQGALAAVESAKQTLQQLEKLEDKSEYELRALKSPNNTSNDKNSQKQQIEANVYAVNAQKAQIIVLEKAAQAAQAQIGKTIIRAPFAGVLSKRNAEVGEVAGSGVPIMTVIKSNEFKIDAYVSQTNNRDIQLGNAAKITMDNNPSVEYNAKVTAIDPAETLSSGISTYKVTFHLDPENPNLISGTDANVNIVLENKSDVLLAPQSAIFENNNKKYVYILKNGLKEEQEISTGIYGESGMTEIISGLSEGDIVLVPKQ